MLIIKTEEDRERCTSCYGNRTIELTMEEVVALFAGATLGDPNFNEYGVFFDSPEYSELLSMLEQHGVENIFSLAGIICACLKGEKSDA